MTMKNKILLFLSLLVVFAGIGIPISSHSVIAADLDQGKALYNGHCASCHGINGDGQGPAAPALSTPPANFTDPLVMANIPYETNERAVMQGTPGTDMRGFSALMTPEEIKNLIAYQRAFLK